MQAHALCPPCTISHLHFGIADLQGLFRGILEPVHCFQGYRGFAVIFELYKGNGLGRDNLRVTNFLDKGNLTCNP